MDWGTKKVNGIYGRLFYPSRQFKHMVTVAAERIWKWWRPSTFFKALQVQFIALVSTFVMVSTVWSVYCLLFFYSRCPPCPAICKSWRARAPMPYGVNATAGWHVPLVSMHRIKDQYFITESSFMKIGWGVSELWGVENRPLPLTRPMAYTTACTTVQAVIKKTTAESKPGPL